MNNSPDLQVLHEMSTAPREAGLDPEQAFVEPGHGRMRAPIQTKRAARETVRDRVGRWVNSNRFALGGSLFLGVILPEMFHSTVARYVSFARILHETEPSLLTTTVALLLAHVLLRNSSSQPFVDSKLIVLPVFLTSFGVCFAVLELLIDRYDLYHPFTGFTLSLIWYILLAVFGPRLRRFRVAVVRSDQPPSDLPDSKLDWVIIAKPRLPRNVMALAFDGEKEQTPQRERLYARAVLRGIPVYDFAYLRERATGKVRLTSRPELVFGQLQPNQPYLRIKRVLDTLLAIPALLLFAPVIAIATVLIRLESPGSPIYRQARVGYQGRIFTCYKLRSMRSDIGGPLYTQETDPRITKIGKFVRKWRIDELPQVVNIIRGEMSWIGPRPEALRLARAYQREIAYYSYRHMVRPGITGWAAVHQGNVALKEAATEKLEFDFYYLKYFSIWLDFVIVLMTIRTIITGFGSR